VSAPPMSPCHRRIRIIRWGDAQRSRLAGRSIPQRAFPAGCRRPIDHRRRVLAC
jgi:hypothetical protein